MKTGLWIMVFIFNLKVTVAKAANITCDNAEFETTEATKMKISLTSKTIWSRNSQRIYYGNYVKGLLPKTGKVDICIKAQKDDSNNKPQNDADEILLGVVLDQSPPSLEKMYLFRTYYGQFIGGAGKEEIRLSPVRQFGKHIRLVYNADAYALQLFVNGEPFSDLLPLNLNIIESKRQLRFFVASSEHASVSLVPSSSYIVEYHTFDTNYNTGYFKYQDSKTAFKIVDGAWRGTFLSGYLPLTGIATFSIREKILQRDMIVGVGLDNADLIGKVLQDPGVYIWPSDENTVLWGGQRIGNVGIPRAKTAGDVVKVVYNADAESVQFFLNDIPNSNVLQLTPRPFENKHRLRFVVMLYCMEQGYHATLL